VLVVAVRALRQILFSLSSHIPTDTLCLLSWCMHTSVSRRCSRHCVMCVDLPGAASQETDSDRQRDRVARRRYVSGFVRVSVALAI